MAPLTADSIPRSTFTSFYKWKFYIIVAVASLIAVFFFPMVGSTAGLALTLPNSRTGWAVYIFSKGSIAVINVLIFHCFMCQGKEDAKNHPNYIEASEILGKYINEEYNPRSPGKWNAQQYGTKATTIFLGTVLGTITLTQAIITYDWLTMLSYTITIIGCIIFGVLQRGTAFNYWTVEYYNYALFIQKKHEEKKKAEEMAAELAPPPTVPEPLPALPLPPALPVKEEKKEKEEEIIEEVKPREKTKIVVRYHRPKAQRSIHQGNAPIHSDRGSDILVSSNSPGFAGSAGK